MPSDEWDAKAREITNPHVICGDGIFSPNTTINAVKAFEAQIAAALREAYLRGRNEADIAAERRGIERAAKVALDVWDRGNAGAHGGEQANRTAAAIRALAPPMADAGPTEPAGASTGRG